MSCNISRLREILLMVLASAMGFVAFEIHIMLIKQETAITIFGFQIPSLLVMLPLESLIIVVATTIVFLCASPIWRVSYMLLIILGCVGDYYLNVQIRNLDANLTVSFMLPLISSFIAGMIIPPIVQKLLLK